MNMTKARYYTGADWINKKTTPLSDWPQRKKRAGDRSRVKSGQTAKAKAMLKRLGL
jgi:hypothetical protein